MKSVFKIFLAFILAGFAFLFLIFLFFGIISILSDGKPEVKAHSVLTINFNSEIVERGIDDSFSSFDFLTQSNSSVIGMDDLKKALKAAKEDDNIDAIMLEYSGLMAGPSTLKDVRAMIEEFKIESDKPIYSYSEVYTQKSYYLASVSDSVFLQPSGLIELSGLSANVAYYKDMFGKIGIKPEIIRGSNNKFKSAVEPYIENEMSESNRLQLETLFGDLWSEYKSEIAASRKMKSSMIQAITDSFAVQSPNSALASGLVDDLRFEDEVRKSLMQATSAKSEDKINFIDFKTYNRSLDNAINTSKNRIAVIYAVGDIMGGRGDENTIGSETTMKAIRKARLDKKVKAIVLRVSSPGGSALASDVIWREMKLAKEAKPLVVSMGDYAASGGYYISAPADTIVTQSNTITGSIGIFMTLFTAEELVEDKMGIHYDVVKTSEFADLGALNRSLNENEKRKLQGMVDEGYGRFLSLVAEGRGLDSLYVDSIGQGRVWTGRRAIELGLADLEGNLDYAIDIAAGMAKLDKYKVITSPKIQTGIEKLMSTLNASSVKEDVLKEELGEYYHYIETLQKMKTWDAPQARMEYELIMN